MESNLKGFYFSPWMATIPLLTMVLPAIGMIMIGVFTLDIMIAGGVVGLAVGSLAAKSKKEYWDIVTASFGEYTGLFIFSLLLIVGIYGELLTNSNLASGFIWLSGQLNFGPELFLVFVYFACSILGTAMGTSVGTIIVMTPVLYPAAMAIGVDPALAAGAILSGAATGDHLSPVSDTTIISSSTQSYRNKEGTAGIGEVVAARMKYVIPSFLISVILYLLAGYMSSHSATTESELILDDHGPIGLFMIIPMLVVIIVAISGRSVFEALVYAILSGIFVALVTGQMQFSDLIGIEEGTLTGVLVEGSTSNIDTIIMIFLMIGCYGLLKSYGIMSAIVKALLTPVKNSPRNAELIMFGICWALNFFLVGLVARITMLAGPIFDEIGSRQNIHPVRRANLLDGVANSFSFIIPWNLWPVYMLITIGPLTEQYQNLSMPDALGIATSTFYPLIIWFVMLAAVITGYGRTFEDDKGNPSKENLTSSERS